MSIIINFILCFFVLKLVDLKMIRIKKMQLINSSAPINFEQTADNTVVVTEFTTLNDYTHYNKIPVKIKKNNTGKVLKGNPGKEAFIKVHIVEETDNARVKHKVGPTIQEDTNVNKKLLPSLNFTKESITVENKKISDIDTPIIVKISEDTVEYEKPLADKNHEDKYGLYVPISEDVVDPLFMHPERKKNNELFEDGLDLIL